MGAAHGQEGVARPPRNVSPPSRHMLLTCSQKKAPYAPTRQQLAEVAKEAVPKAVEVIVALEVGEGSGRDPCTGSSLGPMHSNIWGHRIPPIRNPQCNSYFRVHVFVTRAAAPVLGEKSHSVSFERGRERGLAMNTKKTPRPRTQRES